MGEPRVQREDGYHLLSGKQTVQEELFGFKDDWAVRHAEWSSDSRSRINNFYPLIYKVQEKHASKGFELKRFFNAIFKL